MTHTAIPSMHDADAVRALRATGFGWLSPELGLVACALHEHLAVLAGLGVVSRAAQDRLAQEIARYGKTRARHHKLGMAGEHPAWHCVHLAAEGVNKVRNEIHWDLYAKGWIRLGIHERQPTLHAEGEGKVLRRREREIDDLAAYLQLQPELELVDRRMPWRLAAFDANFPDLLDKA